ncbi:MAG: IS66 family transposase [Acidobacteriaceae bacterium]
MAIDNNISEREMKRVVLHRKNSLFEGNPRGGRTAAVLASLTSSCRRHASTALPLLENQTAPLRPFLCPALSHPLRVPPREAPRQDAVQITLTPPSQKLLHSERDSCRVRETP